MGELGVNKIMGALLATALGLMALHSLSGVVFSHGESGAHHGEVHAETTMSEKMCEKFAYCVEVADVSTGSDEPEEVFDLGLALANADLSKGERVFKGQCSTCHTAVAGGANGTGPNLHNVVGAAKAAHPGFNYSTALAGMAGEWTYQNLNDWLYNPSAYARGTSMSFAGLRKDADRANVIAYLVSATENPPPLPAPLEASATEEETAAPAEGEAAPEGEASVPADGAEAPPAEGSEAAAPAETEAAPAEETETEPAPTE